MADGQSSVGIDHCLYLSGIDRGFSGMAALLACVALRFGSVRGSLPFQDQSRGFMSCGLQLVGLGIGSWGWGVGEGKSKEERG